ncbi:MAG: hypothetical protein KAS32_21765 [Candidatus Peribacteraceae bacterium]|nr:hypothetical protein [Candidatus Peribacteraceae bacterium]
MAKRKYTYAFIKSYIKSEGYTLLLLEREYKNVKTLLKLKCSEGHHYTTSWGHFYHRKHRCKKCNKHTVEFVRGKFNTEGYTLLEKEYINSTVKMKYSCSNGHTNLMTWNNWRNGSRCPNCVKTSYSKVVEGFKRKGYKVLSKEEEYTFAKFKFRFICPAGHSSSMNWYNFKRGCLCGLCAPNAKKNIEEVREAFLLRGYILLSSIYIQEHGDLNFICPNGHKYSITWSNFKKGQDCAKCGINVSKVSQEWLDSLNTSALEREYYVKDLKIRVDGFDPTTNTVYEFLGDYWHGNPEVYCREDINLRNKKSFGHLYKKTFDRLRLLEKAGYKIIYIWEKDYKAETGKV